VDNTFATPYLQHPLETGRGHRRAFDDKIFSAEHSDVGRRRGDRQGRRNWLGRTRFPWQNAVGAVPGTDGLFSWCWRGIKTLPVRMDRHAENAMAIVELLEEHPG